MMTVKEIDGYMKQLPEVKKLIESGRWDKMIPFEKRCFLADLNPLTPADLKMLQDMQDETFRKMDDIRARRFFRDNTV
jgi:hypothetical protein